MPVITTHPDESRALSHVRLYGTVESLAVAGTYDPDTQVPWNASRTAQDAAEDSEGNTYTLQQGEPAFGNTSEGLALWLDTAVGSASLSSFWSYRTNRGFAALIQLVGPPSATPLRGIVRWGSGVDASRTPFLYAELTGSGGNLKVHHDNGTSNVECLLAAPGNDADLDDKALDVLVRYYADGSVQIGYAFDGGALVEGVRTAALTPSTSGDYQWESPSVVLVNIDSAGATAKPDSRAFVRRFAALPDADATLAELRNVV